MSRIILLCCWGLLSFSLSNAFARQTSKISPQCATGGSDAEAIYQQARQYRMGAKGMPMKKGNAEKGFEKALEMGNAKAALQLGSMYLSDFMSRYPDRIRYAYMVAMVRQAMRMGCPEAYVEMARLYEEGWGVRKDESKSLAYLARAAELGSPKGMEFWGKYLAEEKKEIVSGREWLKKAIEAGNGEACKPLYWTYYREQDRPGMIEALRAGAKQGSKVCLSSLELIYKRGEDGQMKDAAHADCYRRLNDAIDAFEQPQPIPNFDRLCPRRRSAVKPAS